MRETPTHETPTRESGGPRGLLARALLAAPVAPQSALEPAGPQADRIADLWWVMFGLGAAVYLVVMASLVVALVRSRRARADGAEPEVEAPSNVHPDPDRERTTGRVVAGAVVLTAAVLVFLSVTSFFTGRAVATVPVPDPVAITIDGHQWWWGVQYDDPVPANVVRTANEIHVPVGRPVELRLRSSDVIHSFWVPSLHGKKDLIPGYTTTTWFQADRPGVYRGQCAEFCGYQHAHMAFTVIAEPPERFQEWLASQRKPAPPPADPALERGQRVFLNGTCVMCHTIAGTPAQGRVGPDLTHLASRSSIAAGTLDNMRGHLAGWVVNSQEIKPGNRMPPNPLAPEDLDALLAYLESLK